MTSETEDIGIVKFLSNISTGGEGGVYRAAGYYIVYPEWESNGSDLIIPIQEGNIKEYRFEIIGNIHENPELLNQ